MFNKFQALNATQRATKGAPSNGANKVWACRINDTSTDGSILVGKIAKHESQKLYQVVYCMNSKTGKKSEIFNNFSSAVASLSDDFAAIAQENAFAMARGLVGKRLVFSGYAIVARLAEMDTGVHWSVNDNLEMQKTPVDVFIRNWLVGNIKLAEG